MEDTQLGYYIIITEFCPFISLDVFLSSFKPTPSEAKTIISQIQNGLKILHEKLILHRDFNPTNILINPDTLCVKIIDFGISKILKDLNFDDLDRPEGNNKYRAPLVDGMKNKFFEDIWGYSCVVLSIFRQEKVTSKKLSEIIMECIKKEKNLGFLDEFQEEGAEIIQNLVKILSETNNFICL